MRTEQECWDEFMRLIDLQPKNVHRNTRCFTSPDQNIYCVLSLVDEMRKIGLKQQVQESAIFKNYFFRCKHTIKHSDCGEDVAESRTLSICIYFAGWVELRWG